jgi:hypothetical protein
VVASFANTDKSEPTSGGGNASRVSLPLDDREISAQARLIAQQAPQPKRKTDASTRQLAH